MKDSTGNGYVSQVTPILFFCYMVCVYACVYTSVGACVSASLCICACVFVYVYGGGKVSEFLISLFLTLTLCVLVTFIQGSWKQQIRRKFKISELHRQSSKKRRGMKTRKTMKSLHLTNHQRRGNYLRTVTLKSQKKRRKSTNTISHLFKKSVRKTSQAGVTLRLS